MKTAKELEQKILPAIVAAKVLNYKVDVRQTCIFFDKNGDTEFFVQINSKTPFKDTFHFISAKLNVEITTIEELEKQIIGVL